MMVMARLLASVNSSALAFPLAARQLNASLEIQSLGRYRVNIPGGFAYEAFNGADQTVEFTPNGGNISSCCLLSCRGRESLPSLQVRKELYDIEFVKAPVIMDVELEHFGTSSFQLKSSAFVNDFPDPLFTSRVTSALICKESRMPKAFPDWWREKFAKEIAGAKPMERLSMSDKCDGGSTKSSFTIDACDVDGYLHTNWSNYVKYFYNAFVEHQMLKSKEYNIDIFRHMKDISLVYKKETMIGDSLSTSVSPHQSDPETFFFSITKAQDVACEGKVQFHPL